MKINHHKISFSERLILKKLAFEIYKKNNISDKFKNLIISIMLKFIPTQTKEDEIRRKLSDLKRIKKINPENKTSHLSAAEAFALFNAGIRTEKEYNDNKDLLMKRGIIKKILGHDK